MENELLTLQEVAKRFRTSEMTITRLIKNKELKAVRIHRLWRIYADSVEVYLERHSNDNLPDNDSEDPDVVLGDEDDAGNVSITDQEGMSSSVTKLVAAAQTQD